jgi:hypothetical protein
MSLPSQLPLSCITVSFVGGGKQGLEVMVFNVTFNNISIISVILWEETRVPGQNHQPDAGH